MTANAFGTLWEGGSNIQFGEPHAVSLASLFAKYGVNSAGFRITVDGTEVDANTVLQPRGTGYRVQLSPAANQKAR